MPTTLIVLAHPEAGSFNGDWARATSAACQAQGHNVLWSDLTSLNFNAVEAATHYRDLGTANFDPLKAQETATLKGTLPSDVSAEVEKLQKADLIVFHFPLWWFAPPAVLKGWLDRVLVHGLLHSVDERFDRGLCRDKRALMCVTTGASAVETGIGGKEGELAMLLWPMAYTLRYLGIRVFEPEAIHSVHGYYEGSERVALEARLKKALSQQDGLIAKLNERPMWAFNSDDDFDAQGRLRKGAPSYSSFIRHPT